MTDHGVVHVIDDEEAVRCSTQLLLESHGHDVRTWPDATSFLSGTGGGVAGCIVIDLRLPDMDGLELQRRLVARGDPAAVIMLTGHGDLGSAVQAMKSGAVEFLTKPYAAAALLTSVADALNRSHALEEERARTKQAEALLARLTERERDVIDGLVEGLSNKQIANQLGISFRTVEIHRANVMSKLGARSLSDVLRVALRGGAGHLLV